MLKRFKLLLPPLAILIFTLFIRLWMIDQMPPSLNWDEVSHGYNAYSIVKTGRDEWNNFFPIIFRAYGDYKLPVYVYTTAISALIFGLNSVSVRLPSILAGTFLVLFTYLLTRKLAKLENVALISAFLVAIEPWSLFLSRAALEANLASALIVSGIYFLLTGLEKRTNAILLGVVLLGLSVWTYNSARIFAPLLLTALLFIYREDFLKHRALALTGGLALVFFVPMLIQLSDEVGRARYENLQILNESAAGRIGELRNTFGLNEPVERLLINKATYFTSQFAINYVRHLSPDFLYLKGGDNYQFNIPNTGLLYLVGAPFLVLGIVNLYKRKSEKFVRILFFWALLAPIASSLTTGSPHTLRSIVFLPIPMIVTAIGINSFIEKTNNYKLTTVVILGAYLFSFGDYFNKYVTLYRDEYSWTWQYGYEEAVAMVRQNYGNYEKFVFTKKYGEPHEFLLFYWPWEPGVYQAQDKIRYFQSNWYWVDRFDKFYFVNDWDVPKVGSEFSLESGETFDCASCLLITSPGNAPENWKWIKTINFLNGKPAFEIYEH